MKTQLKVVSMRNVNMRNNPKYTKEEQAIKSAQLNFIVRQAALHIHVQGKLNFLAEKAGISYEGLSIALRRGWLSGPMACAIEAAVGRDKVTKEVLCPHKYTL